MSIINNSDYLGKKQTFLEPGRIIFINGNYLELLGGVNVELEGREVKGGILTDHKYISQQKESKENSVSHLKEGECTILESGKIVIVNGLFLKLLECAKVKFVRNDGKVFIK